MKPPPCRCAYLPYPHKRNLNCDMLAEDERIAQRDYEDQLASEDRQKYLDMAAELNRGKR